AREPAKGDNGEGRPARRLAAPSAAPSDRPGEPRGDPRDPRRGVPAARGGERRMSTALFSGVDHVGVGVGDMDEGVAFYGRVGFSDVLFDYTGEVPGTDAFTGATPRRARVAMLSNPDATPVGPGRIKLVQVLDGDGPPPVPAGQGWGELGICEICLHVRDVYAVHDR